MSELDASGPVVERVVPSPKDSFWMRELPYVVVLGLMLLGVAYTSVSRRNLVGYWEFMALVVCVAVIATGWAETPGRKARLRLVITQGLHWLSFLIAMNLALLPGVQRLLNPEATGLTVLLLLGLGTVTAGINILSWQICFIGVVMALAVPGIAWLQQSAIAVVLGLIVALLGLGVVYSWHRGAQREAPAAPKQSSAD
ncbi:conserved hypothetical protein [Methylocella silvestris BL2]|uniref:Uncharacterized protein n=1 Tax=Methylocella silvestris (strain DSM 15510 / CIP 108128 / LMG 27833 / NCIMB 13906 / BL2) TaxID=395965 RepID=B8ES46_METSB|nr:hypothetical protein [Methylocella silvestris]ACK52261.1 conserved hypothetical protein [Methylocella silvestris BL2]